MVLHILFICRHNFYRFLDYFIRLVSSALRGRNGIIYLFLIKKYANSYNYKVNSYGKRIL